MKPIFISGIGTGIGKTLVAAVLAEAMKADYWKPVQAGLEPATDSKWVASLVSNSETLIHPETYALRLAASPHISAREENRRIELSSILRDFHKINLQRPLIIEGAGGLMVPLNDEDFVIDLVKALDAKLILVSRNYLGSINHSLMTAKLCRSAGVDVAGWVFNDNYMNYEQEIAQWTAYPILFSLPLFDSVSRQSVQRAASGIELGYLYSLL
ncbi:MAG: dethiobiotin synthase [Bacteroidota bacterium]|nr:dethiobiotin synthase [Bacteroidota bacterium]